ncbi:MAG: hypothetical protein U1F08_12055 [Steroidobacteraceae bacterium]
MTTKAKKPASKPAAKNPSAKPTKAVKQAVVIPEPAALATTPVPKRISRNGVTQPAEGTSCRAVWDAIDKLLAQDKKITLEAVRELAGDKMADATIRTQRQRHKTYHGLTA